MVTCTLEAKELGQKEVQKLYHTPLNVLSPHLKEYLVSRQKAWEE